MKSKYSFNARSLIKGSLTLLIVLFLMPLFISACSFSGKRTEKDFRYGNLSKERGMPRKNSLIGDILTFIVNNGKLEDIDQVIDQHIKLGQLKKTVLQQLKDDEFTIEKVDSQNLVAILKIVKEKKTIISIDSDYTCIIYLEFENNRVKNVKSEVEHYSL